MQQRDERKLLLMRREMQLTLSSILGWSHKQAVILSSQYGEENWPHQLQRTSQQWDHCSGFEPVTMPMLFYILETSCWEYILDVISEDNYQGEMIYCSIETSLYRHLNMWQVNTAGILWQEGDSGFSLVQSI